MTLDRPMRTLAGGEAQRIQLATALGGTLTASLYVLDEPSVGLHARDAARLVDVLRKIRDQGNTVVVVEHAPEIVAAADHVIDLGPGAGRHGGEIVAEGTVDAIRGCANSLTGRALRGEWSGACSWEPGSQLGSMGKPETGGAARPLAKLATARARGSRSRGWLKIVGARANNLRNLSVEIPLGQLVAVTGVSGAGKSSLIRSVLVGQLRAEPDRGDCDAIEGAAAIDEVVIVDPHPPARRKRSNPATVSKAFDGIRRLFASTRRPRRWAWHRVGFRSTCPVAAATPVTGPVKSSSTCTSSTTSTCPASSATGVAIGAKRSTSSSRTCRSPTYWI